MSLSKKALQQKRQNKKKKRQLKIAQPLSSTIIYRSWPIHECWMPAELWGNGIGQIIVSRKNGLGDVAVGIYLIDTFCLGVKDCFVRLGNLHDYQNILARVEETCGELKLIEPSYANTLIHKAIDFAQQFGLKPHQDFVKAKNLLKNIPIDVTQEFPFGKDGKPWYVQGPNESHTDVKRILRTLELNMDKENYNFLIEAPDLLPKHRLENLGKNQQEFDE